MTKSLLERQLEIESQALMQGREKYLERAANASTTEQCKVSMSWVTKNTEGMAIYLQAYFEDMSKQKYQRRSKHTVYQTLKDSNPMMLAHHTLRYLMEPTLRVTPPSLTSASNSLASHILSDMNFTKLSDQHHAKYRAQQKIIEDPRFRSKFSVNTILENAGVVPIQWEKSVKIAVGTFLIETACELYKLWSVENVQSGPVKKWMLKLVPSETLIKWVDEAHSYLASLSPIKVPMVHPPLAWSASNSGGYLTDLFKNEYLVRSFDKEYLQSLDSVDLTKFMAALNAAQDTPYRINTQVLDIMKQCWDQNIRIGSEGKEVLPSKLNLEVPEFPVGWKLTPQEMKVQHPETYKIHARKIARILDKNNRLVSKRNAAQSVMSIADQFKDEKAIYFPHNADFRGRIYPIPVHLNPQGTDLSKGLLEFAEGVPLGSDGAYWLHVHAANCWGEDKVSNEERVQWTEDHMDAILDSALNPMDGAGFWMEADKPFSALAVAFELLKYQIHGDDLVSHLPIHVDGSCNGLQNFSAMLRDPVGAKATNLEPADQPNDIYQDVADLVIRKVDVDAIRGDVLALTWQGHINRGTVKQPVMTLPYGATMNGMRDQILDWMKKNIPDQFEGNTTWEAAGYLAKITYTSINEVVVAARQAMDYLKKVASVTAKSDLPLSWETPVGFPVLQHYKKFKSSRVYVHVNGKRTRLQFNIDENAVLDRRRQGMGVAPNFVHSLDSSHLMLTILLCLENGVHHFAMVHDSFATHAGNTSVLQACIRDSFVEMYSGNILQKFHDEVSRQLSDNVKQKLPKPPEMGTFDLNLVKESQYFFA